ncbi:MAG TPA: hypothetical protein VGL11_00600 [Candidatus Binatia bacterium]|jgi:hypothetical protein
MRRLAALSIVIFFIFGVATLAAPARGFAAVERYQRAKLDASQTVKPAQHGKSSSRVEMWFEKEDKLSALSPHASTREQRLRSSAPDAAMIGPLGSSVGYKVSTHIFQSVFKL